MLLPTDIPTRAQMERLLEARDASSVSIYVPTDPVSRGEAARIELKNLAGEAARQLREVGAPKRDVGAIEEELTELVEDDEFWRYQARSLALFLTPSTGMTFRLANHLSALVEVSDRFHLKPLLRALTFPHTAFVLALSQNAVRLLEVDPELEPAEIDVPDLPSDRASLTPSRSIRDRAPRGRAPASAGGSRMSEYASDVDQARLRQYARQVDQAIRPLVNGLDVPLILAAAEPLDAIYRSVNSYPHLLSAGLHGNPDVATGPELAERARRLLDEHYAAELASIRETYALRASQRRASGDIADVARAATYGLVDTVLVDIDASEPGHVDDETGAIAIDAEDDGVNYGVVDEIARRVWLNGGNVLAVRRDDIPGHGPVAAILRYAP